jgi:hypothetical protein
MSTNVLVEAKKELTKHIINRISPFFYEEFRKLHNKCIYDCNETKNPNILEEFAKKLKDIPEWNQTRIDELFERLQQTCTRQILSNLIKSVWIANVQILSAVRMNKSETETEVNVPDPKRFVHKCFVECAREIYKDPYLFDPNVNVMQLHKNQRELLKLISRSTKDAIRKMLPVEDILRQYLSTDAVAISTAQISDQELKNILNEFEKDDDKQTSTKNEDNKDNGSGDDDVKRESIDESDDEFVPSTNTVVSKDDDPQAKTDEKDTEPKVNNSDDDGDDVSKDDNSHDEHKKHYDDSSSESSESRRRRKEKERSRSHTSHRSGNSSRHRDESIEVPINDKDKTNTGGLFFSGMKDKRF